MQSPFQINSKKSFTLFLKNLPSLKKTQQSPRFLFNLFKKKKKTRLIKNHRIQGEKRGSIKKPLFPFPFLFRNSKFLLDFYSNETTSRFMIGQINGFNFLPRTKNIYIYIYRPGID